MLINIIKGCRKHQRKSQKELYELFYAYGMSITLRYADSREQAAAVFNDALLKVFDNIGKYDSQRPFKPWLRKIIINTAIDHYHKNKKHPEWEELNLNGSEISEEETTTSGISYQEIIEMVQQLTLGYRTVFNLYVIEGYKHEEIAEMLEIAVGTSKSNLAKAKRNLRALLEKNLST
ncbi:MAG: RNA polymerase sigma factor [Balneolales bacterium]